MKCDKTEIILTPEKLLKSIELLDKYFGIDSEMLVEGYLKYIIIEDYHIPNGEDAREIYKDAGLIYGDDWGYFIAHTKEIRLKYYTSTDLYYSLYQFLPKGTQIPDDISNVLLLLSYLIKCRIKDKDANGNVIYNERDIVFDMIVDDGTAEYFSRRKKENVLKLYIFKEKLRKSGAWDIMDKVTIIYNKEIQTELSNYEYLFVNLLRPIFDKYIPDIKDEKEAEFQLLKIPPDKTRRKKKPIKERKRFKPDLYFKPILWGITELFKDYRVFSDYMTMELSDFIIEYMSFVGIEIRDSYDENYLRVRLSEIENNPEDGKFM